MAAHSDSTSSSASLSRNVCAALRMLTASAAATARPSSGSRASAPSSGGSDVASKEAVDADDETLHPRSRSPANAEVALARWPVGLARSGVEPPSRCRLLIIARTEAEWRASSLAARVEAAQVDGPAHWLTERAAPPPFARSSPPATGAVQEDPEMATLSPSPFRLRAEPSESRATSPLSSSL
eukprot:scaffold43917_cov27-Tisochrysis_lutea.AAC.5